MRKLKIKRDLFDEARLKRNLTTTDVAEKVGISRNCLYKITSGRGGALPRTANKIADCLQINVSELFEFVEE